MAESEDKDERTSATGLGGEQRGPDFLSPDDIRGAEQSPSIGNGPEDENPMNFIRDNVSIADKPPGKNRLFEWLGRNKGAVAGGGGAIILLGGLFTITAPMKLQGILSQIEETTTGRLEGYIEKRATKIFSQSILRTFGIVDDRNIVKGGSLVDRIAKTMAANKYEDRLAQKGIQFVANKEGNKVVSVSIQLVGDNTDEAKKLLGKAFKNADDLEAALQGNAVTKKIMKSIIKEDLGIWGYFARGKLAKWMMSYFGISRFGTKATDKNATPEEKMQTQAVDDITNEFNAKGKALENGLDLTSNAENINKTEQQAVASADQVAASQQTLRESISSTLADAKATISKTTSEAMVKAVSKISTELGTKLSELILKKAGTKLVPGYGEVVMVAMGIVFTHWALNNIENGNAARALAMPAAILMGYSYGVWQGYASQAKEGTLDTDLYNYFTPFLDNVETSGLFNCVNTNWQTGCDTVGEPIYKKLNETNNEFLNMLAAAAKADPFMSAVAGDYSPIYLLGRLIFNIDNTIGGVLVDGIMSYLKSVLDFGTLLVQWAIPDSVKADLQAQADTLFASAGQFMLNNILTMFGLNIGPTMAGNQLFDILVNGGTYTANHYMETGLTMHQISPLAAAAQTQQYIAEQQEYDKSKGLMYALFSPEATNSVTSRLVSRMSYGGGAVNTASNTVASLFGLIRSTPSSLASILTNSASAASFTSPEAILNAVPFGITDAEADADVNAAVLSGQPCSTTSIGSSIADWFGISADNENVPYDSCALDSSVAQSMLCSMDGSISETPECNPDAGTTTTETAASNGACPADPAIVSYGTQDGYDMSTTSTKINTCGIKNWPTTFANSAGEYIVEVNAEIANDTAKMAADLKTDSEANGNYDYKASLGFRTFKQQQCIYDYFVSGNRGCSDFATRPTSAAAPGYSNHQMGYSIDLPTNYSCGSPSFKTQVKANEWLNANMKNYGFSRDVGCKDYGHFTHTH